jgi:hypothetical protein
MKAPAAQDNSSSTGPSAHEFVNMPQPQAHKSAANPAGDSADLQPTQSTHMEDPGRPGGQAHDCHGLEQRKHVGLAVQVSQNPSPMPSS